MKNKNTAIIITALLIIIMNSIMLPQSKSGTTIGQFLKIEPSSRAAAMGGAGTSLSGEAASIFYNPAGMGRITDTDVQFTHSPWIADITYNYATLSVPLQGIGTLALQITSLNSGEIDVRTVDQPHGTGERFTVTNFAIGFGYGTMLTDRVSVGILFNYFQESIWHSNMSGYAMNLGVLYEVSEGGLALGAGLMNFGPRAGYNGRDLYINYDFDPDKYGDNDLIPAELITGEYALPTTFRVGISYPMVFGSHRILVSADALHPNDNGEAVNIGGEYTFMDIFSLRGGYRDLFLKDSEGGLVFGAGLNAAIVSEYRVRFDYAWADYGRLKQAHRFTVGISL